MFIVVNGKQTELVNQNLTIMDFIMSKNLDPDQVVVEYNGKVIDYHEWHSITMQEKDCLEVLRFVGGG